MGTDGCTDFETTTNKYISNAVVLAWIRSLRAIYGVKAEGRIRSTSIVIRRDTRKRGGGEVGARWGRGAHCQAEPVRVRWGARWILPG